MESSIHETERRIRVSSAEGKGSWKRRAWAMAASLALVAILGAHCDSLDVDGLNGDNGTGPGEVTSLTKWDVWTQGTRLRGVNIYQARVYEEIDGLEFKGPGPVGPPFIQEDFDALADLEANYVNISHPGVFTEDPPYEVDQGVQDNLDNLIEMIGQADMFAVISFRTGPGRSEFWNFLGDDYVANPDDGFFDPRFYNHAVWTDQAAHDAWADMWRHTAQRYADSGVVVGYDLMVEPNAEDIFFTIWGEPEEFYPRYAGTLYDWNALYPEIVDAIREVDTDTPILIEPAGYAALIWLPFLEPVDDLQALYAVHQYSPSDYTHQEPPLDICYPGALDLDWDEIPDAFDSAWLDEALGPVDEFAETHNVQMAANEFGPHRWVPGAAEFMEDQMDTFERRGMNHAFWVWEPSWVDWTMEVTAFNFRLGPDPDNRTDVESSDLIEVIVENWERNTLFPSNVDFVGSGENE